MTTPTNAGVYPGITWGTPAFRGVGQVKTVPFRRLLLTYIWPPNARPDLKPNAKPTSDSNDAETIRRILIFHDEILSLSAENDKLFEEESEQDEEIKMIKQEIEPAVMLNRWALQAEREKTRHAEEMAKQERERADKAEREVALLKAEIEALRSRE